MRSPLVDHVQAALCRLADAPPATAAARAATAQVEEDWTRRPHVVALDGDPSARNAFVNYLFGGELLDPVAQALRSVPLRIRRAGETRYGVRHRKGGFDTFPLAQPSRAAKVEAALFAIDTAATRLLRVPESRWKKLLWPLNWLRARRAHAELARRPRIEAQVREQREQPATLVAEPTDSVQRTLVERTQQIATLRAWCGSADAIEIVLELADGPLPSGVEVSERLDQPADATVVVAGEYMHAPAAPALQLGTAREVVAILPALLASARALDIARRFSAKIAATLAMLDTALERKDAALCGRIEKLEALRVADAAKFCDHELARAHARIGGAIGSVVEHAQTKLRNELAQFAADVMAYLDRAARADDLNVVAARWQDAAHRVASGVSAYVQQRLAQTLTTLRDELLGTLVARGLPKQYAERVDRVAAPEVAMLPSLAAAEAISLDDTGWLGGLFRSLDSRRAAAIAVARARWQELADRAPVELRDAGAALHAAVRVVLAEQLADAVARHSAWLDDAIAAEREDIERERAANADLVRVRDAARHDLALLGQQVARFEEAHAALAAAVERAPLQACAS